MNISTMLGQLMVPITLLVSGLIIVFLLWHLNRKEMPKFPRYQVTKKGRVKMANQSEAWKKRATRERTRARLRAQAEAWADGKMEGPEEVEGPEGDPAKQIGLTIIPNEQWPRAQVNPDKPWPRA